jgi:hypothetical protein
MDHACHKRSHEKKKLFLVHNRVLARPKNDCPWVWGVSVLLDLKNGNQVAAFVEAKIEELDPTAKLRLQSIYMGFRWHEVQDALFVWPLLTSCPTYWARVLSEGAHPELGDRAVNETSTSGNPLDFFVQVALYWSYRELTVP